METSPWMISSAPNAGPDHAKAIRTTGPTFTTPATASCAKAVPGATKNTTAMTMTSTANTMPIELYCGMQGAGKTYAMVKECIVPALRDPRWQVLSNLDVSDRKTGKRTVNVNNGTMVDFDLLMHLIDVNLALPRDQQKSLLVSVDEIGVAMPQEMWKSDKAMQVVAFCLQMRKARLDFVGTVQHFERAVKVLRDNTNLVHLVRIMLRELRYWKRDVNGPLNRATGKPYRLPWLFEVETLTPDAIHLADDAPRRKKARQGFRRVRFDLGTAASYDTYARVGLTQFEIVPGLTQPEDDPEVTARRVLETAISEHQVATPSPPRRSGLRVTRR